MRYKTQRTLPCGCKSHGATLNCFFFLGALLQEAKIHRTCPWPKLRFYGGVKSYFAFVLIFTRRAAEESFSFGKRDLRLQPDTCVSIYLVGIVHAGLRSCSCARRLGRRQLVRVQERKPTLIPPVLFLRQRARELGDGSSLRRNALSGQRGRHRWYPSEAVRGTGVCLCLCVCICVRERSRERRESFFPC